MEKKNPKLDLEPNRKVYFQLGLFIVGAATLMAFTYKTPVYLIEKRSVEQIAKVPIVFVEKEDKPIVELPKVEKLPTQAASTPIFATNLLNNIKSTSSTDDDPKLVITSSSSTPISLLPFNPEVGAAPEAALVKYPDFDAEFQGSWLAYLKKNMKYPEESIRFNESGTAWVSFVVEIDGSVTDVEVKNKGLSKPLQKEAIRVIKASPRWAPGSKNGEKVRSTKIVKINFILE